MTTFQRAVRNWKAVRPEPTPEINPKSVRYTPRAVVEQALDWIAESRLLGEEGPKRILDPAAGRGIWCEVARELWPDAHITAVEPRGVEAEVLAKVADRVITDIFRPERLAGDNEQFDLIATNPPFELALPFVEGIHRCGLLRPVDTEKQWDNGGALMFLLPDDYGQRKVKTNPHIHIFPPAFQLRVAGPVGFDEGSTTVDQQCYCHFIWTAAHKLDHRIALDLPLIPSEFRRHPTKKKTRS